MTLYALSFTVDRVIEDLEEAVESKRPISALMKQKASRRWLDADFEGDSEALLRLFHREATEDWHVKAAAYYLAVYEDEQRAMKRHLKQLPVEGLCRA